MVQAERVVLMVPQVHQVVRVRLVHLVMEQVVLQEHRVHQELQVLQEQVEHRVVQVHQEQVVLVVKDLH